MSEGREKNSIGKRKNSTSAEMSTASPNKTINQSPPSAGTPESNDKTWKKRYDKAIKTSMLSKEELRMERELRAQEKVANEELLREAKIQAVNDYLAEQEAKKTQTQEDDSERNDQQDVLHNINSGSASKHGLRRGRTRASRQVQADKCKCSASPKPNTTRYKASQHG